MSARAWLLLALFLPLACGRGEPTGGEAGVDRETFIAVYVDLRRAEREAANAEEFEELRRQVFERHGVTLEDLAGFVEREGRNVEEMSEVWNEIEERLRTEAEPDGA